MAKITLFPFNLLEEGSFTLTGTPDTGYPDTRLYDRDINLWWRDTVNEEKNFQVDQGTQDNLAIDFLAIEKHNFNGTQLKWQYSENGTDWVDVVTPWIQSGNDQIIKILNSSLTKRYWRLNLASMQTPKCTEVFISKGYPFQIRFDEQPSGEDVANVDWRETLGSRRATLVGEKQRFRQYSLFLQPSDITSFEEAMDYLYHYSRPFYIKDHKSSYFMCTLTDTPKITYVSEIYDVYNLSILEQV